MERRIGLCIFVILCNTTLGIVSIATPNWIITHVNDSPDGTIVGYTGLWKECASFEGITICKAFPKVEDWLKGVLALMITGVFLLGLSCVLAVVFARNSSNHQYVNTCKLSLILSDILFVVALVAFAHKKNDMDDVSFGYSFYLPIPVIILSTGTAFILHEATDRLVYT